MKRITVIAALSLLLPMLSHAGGITGKFAPPQGKILMFIGQDNASVGGNGKYHDGYVDNVGVPGGITHYIYFSQGWTNKFKRVFKMGTVAGLNNETEWAAGPMCLKAYVDSPLLDRCVIHVSIAMEGNNEDRVADGSQDQLISEFVAFVRDHQEHPFLIRIGYEFDGKWNGYDPENFKKAFRRIVDALRAAKLTNFATVLASSGGEQPGTFEKYDPGLDYYDWVGFSWFGATNAGKTALAYARKVGKPVFIAESTAFRHYLNKEDPKKVWKEFFERYFRFIEDNKDVVRAVSYINCDWDAQDMWDNWGQTRIETSPVIKRLWQEKMTDPTFINAKDNPFEQIGFHPGARTSSP